NNELPAERAWQIAHEAAQRAVDWYPVENGDHYDRLGRVYEWKHIDEAPGSPAASESRRLALEFYQRSLAVRPQVAYTWLQLAFVKLRMNEIDQEFISAWENIHYYAPWRGPANRGLAELGFIAWDGLGPEQRLLAFDAASRAIAYG